MQKIKIFIWIFLLVYFCYEVLRKRLKVCIELTSMFSNKSAHSPTHKVFPHRSVKLPQLSSFLGPTQFTCTPLNKSLYSQLINIVRRLTWSRLCALIAEAWVSFVSMECRTKVRFVIKPIWSSSKVSLVNQNYSLGKWRLYWIDFSLYRIDLRCVSKRLYMCIEMTSICIETTGYEKYPQTPHHAETADMHQPTVTCGHVFSPLQSSVNI